MEANTTGRLTALLIMTSLGVGLGLIVPGLLKERRPEDPDGRSSGAVPTLVQRGDSGGSIEKSFILRDENGLRAENPAVPNPELRAAGRATGEAPVVFRGEVEVDPTDESLVAHLENASEEKIRFFARDVSRVEADENGEKNLVLRTGQRVRLTEELLEVAPRSVVRKATYTRSESP